MFSGRYDLAVDMWSCGVLMYLLPLGEIDFRKGTGSWGSKGSPVAATPPFSQAAVFSGRCDVTVAAKVF